MALELKTFISSSSIPESTY